MITRVIRKKLLASLILFTAAASYGQQPTTSSYSRIEWETEPSEPVEYYIVYVENSDGNFILKTRHSGVIIRGSVQKTWVRGHSQNHALVYKTRLARVTFIEPPLPAVTMQPQHPPMGEKIPEAIREIAMLEEEEKHAFQVEPYRLLGLGLALGQEGISASGGESSFSGTTSIVDTAFFLYVDPELQQTSRRWSYLIFCDFHRYRINNQKTMGTQNKFEALELTQYDIGLSFYYSLRDYTAWDIKIGPGLTILTTPSLNRERKDSRNRDFINNTMVAPTLNARMNLPHNKKFASLLRLDMHPFAFKHNFVGLEASYALSQNIIELFSLNYIAKYSTRRLRYTLDCGQSSTCQTRGMAQDWLFELGVGLTKLF